MFPLLPPEPRFAWDPVETRTADDAIEDLLLVLARAGLTPLAVHCTWDADGTWDGMILFWEDYCIMGIMGIGGL
jgi:hypothetical protein